MKKVFLSIALVIAVVLVPRIMNAQSDKDIIKEANADIKNKAYDLAFQKIITVSQPEKKKAQEVLKSCYPKLIADYLSKATAIKFSDKDSLSVKREKLEQVISYLDDALIADSLFKKCATAELYKSLSKKKKIESTKKTSVNKLKTINDILIKREQDAKANDTLALDTTSQVQTPVQTSTDANATNQFTNTTEINSAPKEAAINTSTTPSGEKKYYIIAGSYKTEADAQVAVNNLKNLGYASSEIVGQNAYGSYRISYNGFATKEEAAAELEKIKLIQTDAWILEK